MKRPTNSGVKLYKSITVKRKLLPILTQPKVRYGGKGASRVKPSQ